MNNTQPPSGWRPWRRLGLASLVGIFPDSILAFMFEDRLWAGVMAIGPVDGAIAGVPVVWLLYYGLGTPIIEEVLKALGVLYWRPRLPSAREAGVLGMAAGSGFGACEALTYLINQPDWPVIALTRLGVVVLHGACTGMVCFAAYRWRYGSAAQRWKASAAVGAAIAVHGAYNSLNLLSMNTALAQPLWLGEFPVTGAWLLSLALILGLAIGFSANVLAAAN